jgi:signal transduction histidine kinase
MTPWFIPDDVHVVHGVPSQLRAPGRTTTIATASNEKLLAACAADTDRSIATSAQHNPNHQPRRFRSTLARIIAQLSRIVSEEGLCRSNVFTYSPQKKKSMARFFIAGLPRHLNGHSHVEYAHNDQELLLQGVLRSLTEHIAVLDADGTIIAVNEAWDRFAQENGAADLRRTSVGVNYLQVCRSAIGPFSEGMTDVVAGIQAVLHYLSPQFTLEYPCPSPDQERWFLMHVTPLPEEHGGAVVVHIDITERRQAEQQRLMLERKLMEAQKLESLGILAGGIAHDFNNLLASILGSAELALLDLPLDTPAYANVKHVELATRRAAELTRQMLTFAGKRQLVAQLVDLNAVVTEMCNLLTASVARHVDLWTKLHPHLPMIAVDAIQIRQVIMNLVINAAEALRSEDGRITITTGFRHVDQDYLATTRLANEARTGDYIYLEVTDTGYGMDRATLERIFDPFFTTKQTGHGLGLAAVLDIVRGHKGTIKVTSAVGQGTTFTVLVPCSTPASHCGSVDESALTATEHYNTILVIEDEENVRTVIRRMLERLGFTVLVADNGRTGLNLFRAQSDSIDCVLIDLTVPHLDGAQLLPEIRRIRPDAPVVLMSGYTEEEVARRFATDNLPIILIKPFTSHDLREKIRQAIAHRA